MSSLTMTLPAGFPVAPAQWRSHAGAAVVTLALHAGVFGLLLHGWTPQLSAPSQTQVLKTQLISLPAPNPVEETVVEPERAPEPAPLIDKSIEEPQVDPQIEQQRLEQAEVAYKRAEQERLAEEARIREQQRIKEQQRKEQLERERQDLLEVERQQHEAERRELLAREEQQRQQAARAEATAAAERARQAAAASRQYLPIAKDAPDYPSRALDKGIEGTCTVTYSVNPQGRIENPKALEDCHPLFIRPSLTAAKSFRYQPRIVDGRAVTVPEVKNTFHYRIQ
ncbi:TonB family protein [Stutzerimonas zhaodongensis]|uniref:TonB family protein n=1 Tax=Stutzerimonas zhaodongensis TaxID=1176257 RepID=UPI0039EF49E2